MNDDIHFYIYSSGFNCSSEVVKCINSVLHQTYQNYTHIVVDDCSTDDTYKKLYEFGSDQLRIFRNSANHKWLRTAELHLKPKADDVVLLLDLDDYLYDSHVLEKIARRYRETKCWLTYGNFVSIATPDKLHSQCRKLPAEVLEQRSFRSYAASFGFFCGHPQTFRGFLWQHLDFTTLLYKGTYPPMSADSGVMMAMLEMCKPGKIEFINEKLYVYNDCRQLNDHNIDSNLQWWISQCYYKLPKYDVLER